MNIKYQRKLLLIDERTSSILRLKANFRTCWRILEFTVSDFHWEEHNFGKTSFLKLFTHDINNEWQCSVAVCHLKMFVSSKLSPLVYFVNILLFANRNVSYLNLETILQTANDMFSSTVVGCEITLNFGFLLWSKNDFNSERFDVVKSRLHRDLNSSSHISFIRITFRRTSCESYLKAFLFYFVYQVAF